jgi:CRISPR-associated protein (TIGR02584 family)
MTKRVLIITMGETPQIVTETVYALLKDRDLPWIPDRIILATTGSGERIFRNGSDIDFKGDKLRIPIKPLVGETGQLKALYNVLGRSDVFVEPEIQTARTPDGLVINDVRSEFEIDAFAELVMDLVRDVTANPETELHLSFAGGRKTMSTTTAQILSIFGRSQDILSHCLVEDLNVEKSDDFWWPGNNPATNTQNAKILLHESPYVRFRASISETEAITNRTLTFKQIVDQANNALSAKTITLDLVNFTILVGNTPIPFTYRKSPTSLPRRQMKELRSIAIILVAAKKGWEIRRRKNPKRKLITDPMTNYPILMNDDRDQFVRVSAVCTALCYPESANEDWEDNVVPAGVKNGNLFLRTQTILANERLENTIKDDLFGQGCSDARKLLRDKQNLAFANRVVSEKKSTKRRKSAGAAEYVTFKTQFTPDQITIILPPGLDMEEFEKD